MNALVVKALCRRIQTRYGSNAAAAMAAGVVQSQWSYYCSDDHPDTTIPFHRLLLVANAAERRIFADLLLGDEGGPTGHVLMEAVEASLDGADVLREAQEAASDGVVTPLEGRRLRERAINAKASLDDVIRAADEAVLRPRRVPFVPKSA